jgi:LysM repeat protein/ribosomal protein S13
VPTPAKQPPERLSNALIRPKQQPAVQEPDQLAEAEDVWQTVNQVAKDNNITNPNLIRPGQQIKLPNGQTYIVKAGDTLGQIVQQSQKIPVAGAGRGNVNPSTVNSPAPDTNPNGSATWKDSSGRPVTSSDGTPVTTTPTRPPAAKPPAQQPPASAVKPGPNPNIDDPTRQRAQAFVDQAGAVIIGNEKRAGGTVSWRTNNPGNVSYGDLAKQHGAIGTWKKADGDKQQRTTGIAIMPTLDAGTNLQMSLWRRPLYNNRSIVSAVNMWTKGIESNNLTTYASDLAKAAGVDVNAKVADLSDEQLRNLVKKQAHWEGFKPGQIAQVTNSQQAVAEDLETGHVQMLLHKALQARREGKPLQSVMRKEEIALLSMLQGSGKLQGMVKNKSVGEAPIEMDPSEPMNPTIYGHQGVNPAELKTRMMRAQGQLADLAKRAQNASPIEWEIITRNFKELSMNIEQIRHALEELAKVRKRGGIRSRGIDKNIGEQGVAEEQWDSGEDVTVTQGDQSTTYQYKGCKFVVNGEEAQGEAWWYEPGDTWRDAEHYNYVRDQSKGIDRFYNNDGQNVFNLSATNQSRVEQWVKAKAKDFVSTMVAQPNLPRMNEQGVAEAGSPAQQAAIAIAKKKEAGVDEEKQRLDPSCWKGYRKQGTKMKGNTRVNNCVPVSEDVENIMAVLIDRLIVNEAIQNNKRRS